MSSSAEDGSIFDRRSAPEKRKVGRLKSRRRCLAVAIWLALPSVMSLELSNAFRSEVALSRCGLVTAALNIPGFALSYPLSWRLNLQPMPLILIGDMLFWVPLFYGFLRMGQHFDGRRRIRRSADAVEKQLSAG